MLSIDEAIEKNRKIAEMKKTIYDACILEEYNRHLLREYKENEQLAEWLELLKWYQQGMEDIPSESGVLPKDVYRAGYIKAIDDFASELINHSIYADTGIGTEKMEFVAPITRIRDVAEQLKAGGENENIH